MADDLHIGRATLFRWVGNRDLLIGEILWSLYELYKKPEPLLGHGVDYVAGVFRHINMTILHFSPLRKFLHQIRNTRSRCSLLPIPPCTPARWK